MYDTTHTTLGELIEMFYEEYLALYRDEELASVATAATINDLLCESARGADEDAEAHAA